MAGPHIATIQCPSREILTHCSTMDAGSKLTYATYDCLTLTAHNVGENVTGKVSNRFTEDFGCQHYNLENRADRPCIRYTECAT